MEGFLESFVECLEKRSREIDIPLLPLKELSAEAKQVWIYGVVIHLKPVKRSCTQRAKDYLLTAIITDPTLNYPNGVVLLIFNPFQEHLPNLEKGDVVKCRVNIQEHYGKIQAISKPSLGPLEILTSAKLPTALRSAKNIDKSPGDSEISTILLEYFKHKAWDTYDTLNTKTLHERKAIRLQDIKLAERYVTVDVQIVAIGQISEFRDCVQLFVTDYTVNAFFQDKINALCQNFVFPPCESSVLPVTLWDQHCEKIELLTPGQHIRISNLHIRNIRSNYIVGSLHSSSANMEYAPSIELSSEKAICELLKLQNENLSKRFHKAIVNKNFPIATISSIIDSPPLVSKLVLWARVADLMPRDLRNACVLLCRECKAEFFPCELEKRLRTHCNMPLSLDYRFALLLCDGVRDLSVIVSGIEATNFIGMEPMDLYDEINLAKFETALRKLISSPKDCFKSDPCKFGIASYIVNLIDRPERRFKLICTKLNLQ